MSWLIVGSLVGLMADGSPRFSWAPPCVSNSAPEAIDLCAQIGMPLDPWQQVALELMLGERADGQWSAFEFGLVVARQNGKGGVLEARELAGLFLFGEQLIIHSAHEFATAAEAFRRMKNLIESTAWLSKRVKKVMNSHGSEGFELMSGQRLSYRTRTAGGGRGFSGDVVILDEAQKLDAGQLAALMPTLSARPNPQLIYTGTVTPDAAILRRVVERGRKGGEDHLAFAEWSAPDDADPTDREVWAQANPALGIRISPDYVAAEQQALPSLEFSMERLSIWPDVSTVGSVISVEAWRSCLDVHGQMPGPVTSVGVAVAPGRDWASVGVAGQRPDGTTYVETVKLEQGTDWLLPWLASPDRKWVKPTIVVDQGSPAGTLLAQMGALGLKILVTDTKDYKVVCASFVDAVNVQKIVHRGQPPLTEAATGVKEHRLGDQWVFSRRDSGVLIAPLEAVALAAWHSSTVRKRKPFVLDWDEDLK